ncbi:hypothetical protein E3N88_00269 [Mikania micrantha]|uniref:Uncharacterized protein n=1 Tax=Mikania micrantha TaxID=192012 RepID=A0A5N6PYF4_9ASTR|nr:hypothetical protein E3N88_00269 [Mikania micrantha]
MVYRRGGGLAAGLVATDSYVCPIHKLSSVYHEYVSVEDLKGKKTQGPSNLLHRYCSIEIDRKQQPSKLIIVEHINIDIRVVEIDSFDTGPSNLTKMAMVLPILRSIDISLRNY